jgi:hypothetical protein
MPQWIKHNYARIYDKWYTPAWPLNEPFVLWQSLPFVHISIWRKLPSWNIRVYTAYRWWMWYALQSQNYCSWHR